MSDARIVIDADAGQVVVEAGKARRAVTSLASEVRRSSAASSAFSAAGRRQAQTLGELGRTARRATLTLGTLAAAGFAHAARAGIDFEKQMDALGAATDATAGQMEKLRKQAMKAGADTAFSAGEAAKAQTELAKGGLTLEKILSGGLNSALSLAAAGELELADAASITANAMNLFGLEGKDATMVADALATAANNTTAEVDDFGMALKAGGSVAKSAGLSFTDTMVALEALAASGIKNSDAGTSLKTALIQLIKPSDEQAEKAKKLGLEFVNANGEMKSMADISTMLRDRLKGMGDAQRTATLATLAGTDGVRTLTSLYDAGPRKLEAFERGLLKAGSAAEVAKRKQDNAAGAFEQLTGSIESVEIALWRSFEEPLKDALLEATQVVNTKGKEVEEFFDRVFEMPEFQAADIGGKLSILLDEFDKTGLPGRMRDLIVEGFTDGLDAALPIVIKGAALLAVEGAKAFGKAFIDADPLSRVLLTGYLLHKTGALAAFRAYGKTAGAQVAVGAAAGAGTAAAGAGWKAAAKDMGKSFGLAAAVSAAVAFGPEVAKSIKESSAGKTPDFGLPKRSEMKVGGINFDPIGLFKLGQNLSSGKDRLRDFGAEADRTFAKLKQAGDSRGLSELADQARKMAREFPDAARALNAFADTAERTAGSAGDQFALMRKAAGKNLKAIAQTLADTSFEIRQRFGPDTAKAKDALSHNFMLAAQAIRKSMNDGKISTRTGMREIEELFVKALAQYGLSRKEAINRAHGKEFSGKSTAPTVNKARGGLMSIGRPGVAAADNVPAVLNGQAAMVAEGEQIAVFNRHQQAEMNARLAGEGGLAGFFSKHRKPHYLAGGGIVGLGRQLQSQGYQVGEHPAFGGVGGGHAPAGYHPKGMAIDVNADGRGQAYENQRLDALYSRLKGMAGVVELLWRTAGHFDHLHVAMSGAGGKLGGLTGAVAAEKIKRVTARGDLGAVSAIAQQALDVTREGAQGRLDSLAEGLGAVEGAEGPMAGLKGGTSGGNQKLGHTMMLQRWAESQWPALKELWTRESGWSNTARNPSSGAFGIPQALPPGKMGAAAVAGNARAQIDWGLRYIAERYGSPSAALGFHNAHNWYAQGGIVKPGVTQGPGRGRLARKPGSKPGRPYKPRKAKFVLKDITELGQYEALAEQLEANEQTYANTEREQGLTDEQPLRTDADGNEVRNEDDINRRVSEIDALVAIKKQSADWLDAQQQAAGEALRKLMDGMRERVERINAVKAAARANIDRIRFLSRRVAELDRAEKRTKGKAHEKLIRANKPERRAIARELDGLRDDNERLVGSRSVDVDLDEGNGGGLLETNRDQLQTWTQEREKLSDSAKAIPQNLFNVSMDIAEKRKEREQWTGTVAPKIDVPAPDQTLAQGDEGRAEQLAELLRSQLADERARSRMLATQFDVFKDFAPLAAMRFQGHFARGLAEVRETGLAVIHKGESIGPDPEGPFGSQLSPSGPGNVQVTLMLDANLTPLMGRVRAEIDGRAAKVVSEQLGRRSRLIASAPGGRR